MALVRFSRRSALTRPSSPAAAPPRPWPVDPELARRVTETLGRIEHTRRQLARHVLPDHDRQPNRAANPRRAAPGGFSAAPSKHETETTRRRDRQQPPRRHHVVLAGQSSRKAEAVERRSNDSGALPARPNPIGDR